MSQRIMPWAWVITAGTVEDEAKQKKQRKESRVLWRYFGRCFVNRLYNLRSRVLFMPFLQRQGTLE